jgi:long-chain acyl-CoA synthetase
MTFNVDLHRHTIKLPARVGGNKAGGGRPLEMSVVEAGPAYGDKLAAPTMVLIHGFGGRAAYWEAQLEQFQENFRVIALDLRGHGYTDAPDEDDGATYAVPELVDDIACALDALEVPRRFVLISHSFGGALAAYFISRHPGRVSSLVIIASAVRFRLRLAGRLLLRVPPAILDRVRNLMPLFGLDAARLYPPSHVVYLQNRNALAPWDGTPYLKAIDTPTLVILGHRDILFAAESYQDVARLIPGAQEVVVPVSAHQVMVERPDAVNRAIERFLEAQVDPLALANAKMAQKAARRAAKRALEAQRPWLKFYDARTPYGIKLPQAPLPRLLEATARRYAGTVALTYFGRRIRWRELDRLANRFAHGLLERGLAPGERVLLALPNCPQWVIAYYGVLKAGGVAVLGDAAGGEQALLERAAQSRAAMLLTGDERYDALHLLAADARLAGVRRLIFASRLGYMGLREKARHAGAHPGMLGRALARIRSAGQRSRYSNFHDMLARGRIFPPDTVLDVDAVAVLAYTFGTTGRALPVPLTHRNLAANALQLRHWLPEARPGDERFLAQQPFGSAYGLTCLLHLGVYLGATLVLLPDADIDDLLRAVSRQRPTFFPTTPDVVRRLAHTPGVRRYGLATIRVCAVSGSHLPVEVREEFEKLTRGRLIEAYGLTEASPAVLAIPVASRRPAGVVGIPLPDTEVQVRDFDSGEQAPADTPGQLWVRGPQVFNGYDDNEAATRARLQTFGEGGPWLRTGDVARMDEDGFVTLIDREDNMVLRANQRVFPRQVEEILFEHPAVALARVRPVKDAAGGVQLHAHVLLHRNMNIDSSDLLRFASKYLQAAATPDSITLEHPQ